MKSVLFSSLIVLVLSQACGQKKIPNSVITTFNNKFKNATNVNWDRENENEWEAEFKLAGKKYSANFNNEGEWLETEYNIDKPEIPSQVLSALNTFEGYTLKEAEISETNKGKNYEFLLKNKDDKMEVVVAATGEIIRREHKNAEEDTD